MNQCGQKDHLEQNNPKEIPTQTTTFKGVIFDLDGTLVDTLASLAKSGNDLLAHYGYPPQPTHRYQQFAGNGARVLVERALEAAGDQGKTDLEEAFHQYQEGFKESCTYQVEAYPGLVEILEKLHQKGIRTAVLTNKPQWMAEKVLGKTFPAESLDLICGQQEGNPLKPDPKAANRILNTWKLSPQECAFVGDSNVDIQMGRGANFYTIGVTWGFRSLEELLENGAQAIAHDDQELEQHLGC